MLKVIIVDDEILIRIGIKSCMEWEKYGFEIIGQAEDGEKAIELIKKEKPDIVLTDIRMPKKDGLELICYIKEKYPEIKTIVLSCHNEIEYVKKAIKLGAEDYILKLSMQPETLLDVLNKVKDAIENGSTKDFKNEIIKSEVSINRYLIKENFYKKLMDESLSVKEFRAKMNSLGYNFGFDGYMVICCGIDDYKNAPLKSSLEDQHLLKFSLINILEEILTSICNADIAEIENGIYLILLTYKNPVDSNFYDKVSEQCEKVNNALKKYLNISASFGMAAAFENFAEIKKKYSEANQALEYKFYTGRESMVFYDDLPQLKERGILFNYKDEKGLLDSLEKLDVNKVKYIIDTFLKDIHRLRQFLPAKVRMAAIEVLYPLIKFAKKYDLEIEFIMSDTGEHPVEILMNAETISDIKDWFNEFIDKLAEYISYIKQSDKRPEIPVIKQYIMEHLDENITLDKAAKICNISRCYFSSIFKKVTGENFTDYLNRVKMEKAKELIFDDNLKVYEAALRVGITDESHFSKVFKKYIGVSPSKVRNNMD